VVDQVANHEARLARVEGPLFALLSGAPKSAAPAVAAKKASALEIFEDVTDPFGLFVEPVKAPAEAPNADAA
jgi:hypothetical protein